MRTSGGGAFPNRLMGQNFGTAGMKPGVSVQQVQTTTGETTINISRHTGVPF